MLHIIKFKGCQRCGGDLFLESDYDGTYMSCLQCGAVYPRRLTQLEEHNAKELVASGRRGKYR